MNTTPLVGCIALLMIIASSIWGQEGSWYLKASALEGRNWTQELRNMNPKPLNSQTLSNSNEWGNARYIQIIIDGQVYSGTVFMEIGGQK